MKKVLIIFGRLPNIKIPAKTRLGKEIGNEIKARKIGHDLTEQALEKFSGLGGKKIKKYFCYGGTEYVETRCIVSLQENLPEYTFFPQPEKKDVLGMKDAFEEIFSKFSPKKECKIILIGTDIIGLDKKIIEDCFDALNYFDACIVPVEDKGYGAVGLSKNIDIFSKIQNWNSRSEGYNLVKETENLCTKKNLSLFVHPKTCFDVDTKQDLLHWQQEKKL